MRQRPFAATPESELTRVGCLTSRGQRDPSDPGYGPPPYRPRAQRPITAPAAAGGYPSRRHTQYTPGRPPPGPVAEPAVDPHCSPEYSPTRCPMRDRLRTSDKCQDRVYDPPRTLSNNAVVDPIRTRFRAVPDVRLRYTVSRHHVWECNLRRVSGVIPDDNPNFRLAVLVNTLWVTSPSSMQEKSLETRGSLGNWVSSRKEGTTHVFIPKYFERDFSPHPPVSSKIERVSRCGRGHACDHAKYVCGIPPDSRTEHPKRS